MDVLHRATGSMPIVTVRPRPQRRHKSDLSPGQAGFQSASRSQPACHLVATTWSIHKATATRRPCLYVTTGSPRMVSPIHPSANLQLRKPPHSLWQTAATFWALARRNLPAAGAASGQLQTHLRRCLAAGPTSDNTSSWTRTALHRSGASASSPPGSPTRTRVQIGSPRRSGTIHSRRD